MSIRLAGPEGQLAHLEAQIARHEQAHVHSIEPLLTIQELADAIGKSVRTIRRFNADHRIRPAKRNGRKLLYRLSDFPGLLGCNAIAEQGDE